MIHPQRLLWTIIALLSVGILGYIIFSPASADPADALRAQSENSRDQFDQVSFWESLLEKSGTAPREKYSAYDGLSLDPDTEESPVTVMIDNFSLARPQHTGIRSASIVYESLVEGGITRLMLVMPYQDLAKVGPIRSARDYFVDYAEEYGGTHVHAGGSPTALERLIASERVWNMDEDDREGNNTYSFRDPNYDPPHNLFVDLFLVREFVDGGTWAPGDPVVEWCFVEQEDKEDKEPTESISGSDDTLEEFSMMKQDGTGKLADRIELNYSNDVFSSYFVQFRYDELTQSYDRYYRKNAPQLHIDQHDGEAVSPKNIIVQIAPSFLIPGDEKERIEIQHLGSGKAFFFQQGEVRKGTWTKEEQDSPTQFFEENGTPLCLHPGQTWVSVLDSEALLEMSSSKDK